MSDSHFKSKQLAVKIAHKTIKNNFQAQPVEIFMLFVKKNMLFLCLAPFFYLPP